MTTTLESRPIADPQPAIAPLVEPSGTPDAAPSSLRRRWVGVAMAVVLAAVSGWAFTTGIGVPWPWSDEGATYLAMQRSFSQLIVLYNGPDAPLVPYYLLTRAWTQGLQAFWPLLPTLTAVRLLSAAAATATVVVLYALVSRNVGRLAGLLSGLLLISLPGFDRLAQEARPYTLLGLAATTSWLMWDRWLQPGRRPGFWPAEPGELPSSSAGWRGLPSGVGYLASLVGLGLVHTFGLFQWPAQFLAATLTRRGRPWLRWRAVMLTAGVLGLAGLVTAGQTFASLTHGTGSQSPNAARVVNLTTIGTTVLRGFFLSTAPLVVVPVLALVVVGLLGTRVVRSFAVTTLVWLLVPLAMELGLSVFKTNLFRSRYWVADLPPLAAAAGLGLTVIAHTLYRLISSRASGGRGGHRWLRGVAATTAIAVVAGAMAFQGTVQAHEQSHLRTLRGHHGESLTGILKIVDQTTARHPHIPVLISSGAASGILGAARPQLQAHNPLRTLDPTAATVFTVPASQSSVRAQVGHSSLLLWIFRGSLTASSAAARIPHGLAGLHMRVSWAVVSGNWTAILLHPGSGAVSNTTASR